MTPTTRRIVQAVLYEAIALAVVSPALGLLIDRPASSTLGLAVFMSTVALVWSYVFNTVFERWEARQAVKGRSLRRRIAHGLGIEGGLTIWLVPAIAGWLDVSLRDAFVANLGILAFFFVYAIVFTWGFDRVFGLPVASSPIG